MAPWIEPAHRRQFAEEGFMVIRNVIPRDLTEAAVHDIAAFLHADLTDPATWYNGVPVLDGVVPLHHPQSLWNIRQCPNLYQVFVEHFGTPHLRVDINRCLFRPPIHPSHPTLSHGSIHWDTCPKMPGPGSVQSLVLLTDVKRNGGGYQCLPDIYQNLDLWLEKFATDPNFDFFNPGLNQWKTKQVEGNAGDVILWSTKLPHGTASNLSDRPRIATFITMQPPPTDPDLAAAPKTCWLTKRAPVQWRGLPGQVDPEPGEPAVLTELGLKLIGAAPW